jgi:hypothetical protein
MKKTILLLALTLGLTVAKAADTLEVNIDSIQLSVNKKSNFSIRINVFTGSSGKTISSDYWLNGNNQPLVQLVYKGFTQTVKCTPVINLAAIMAGKGFGIKLSSLSPDFIKYLQASGDSAVTLQFVTNVTLAFTDGTFGTISNTTLNAAFGNITITDSARADYIGAVRNFYYYQNKSDFGIEPNNSGSNNTVYFVTLKNQNVYPAKNTAACSPSGRLYWSLDTRLSTNPADSLNYLKVYPINLKLTKPTQYATDISLQLGNEANQTFNNKRVSVNLAISQIVPNFVNLVTPNTPRLRLKPILTAGVKGYYDYSNDQPHFFSGQAFAGGYYYIPIYTNYALIVEGNGFYDFSKERNPDKKVKGNYSLILGTEIPKTGFKAMFKYINGQTDINFKQGQVIALGLLMDFIQEKNNTRKPTP